MSFEGIETFGRKGPEIQIIDVTKFPENENEAEMFGGFLVPKTFDNYEDAIADIMEDVNEDIASRADRLYSLINSLRIAYINRGEKTYVTNTHLKGCKDNLKELIKRGGPITIYFSEEEYITFIRSEITEKVVFETNSPEVSEFLSRGVFDRVAPITAQAMARYKELMN